MTRQPLHEFLLYSATRQTWRALDILTDDQRDAGAFYAASAAATEQMLCAVLANVHPLLILADSTKYPTPLELVNGTSPWPQQLLTVRTPNVRTLVERAKHLVPSLNNAWATIEDMANHRNAAVHSGGCPDNHEKHVGPWLTWMKGCVDACGWSWDQFIGEHEQQADDWLQGQKTAVETRVAARMAASGQRMEQHYGPFGGPWTEVEHLYDRAVDLQASTWDEEHAFEYECPVCGLPGTVYGWRELEPSVTVNRDGDPEFEGYVGMLWISEFECPTCRLYVQGDELAVAGVAESLEFDPTDDMVAEHQREMLYLDHPEYFKR